MPVRIQEVSEAEGLSAEYGAKLLGALRRGGLVQSVRGVAGGYLLVRPPEEISVWSILTTLDSPLWEEVFCGGFSGIRDVCVRQPACTVKNLWGWLGGNIRQMLEGVTLADMVSGHFPVGPNRYALPVQIQAIDGAGGDSSAEKGGTI